jgi:hypothetical protein
MASALAIEQHQVTMQGDAASSEQSRPVETFEIEEEQNGDAEESIVYPSGSKLWFTMASLCIACFLSGLVNTGIRNLQISAG